MCVSVYLRHRFFHLKIIVFNILRYHGAQREYMCILWCSKKISSIKLPLPSQIDILVYDYRNGYILFCKHDETYKIANKLLNNYKPSFMIH